MSCQARTLASSASALLLAAAASAAQTVKGTIADAGGRPVPGVVLFLIDSASNVAARTLSDARGSFTLPAARAGTYRVRTQRIGFRPTLSDPVALLAGGEATRSIALTGVALALDTVRVVDRDVCRAFSDSSAATFRVWEQIRAALTATQITSGSRTVAATTVTYDRSVDPGPGRTTGKVLRERSNTSTEYVTRAWRTQPPDTLHRAGYVITRGDNTVDYYAPGLDMLLSDVFVGDHCFRMTTDRKQPSLVGITFEPTPERKKGVPEIRGTLWVEKATSELRRLEFRYVSVPPEVEPFAGGEMDFVRMRDGAWAVGSWSIRMPVVETIVRPGHGAEPHVGEVLVNGGDLTLARRGTDTLWARASNNVVAAAAPGVVLTPSGPQVAVEKTYVLVGSVGADSGRASVAGAEVTLADVSRSATTDEKGEFRIAGIPAGDHRAQVRAIGYGMFEATVSFGGADTVTQRIVLRKAVALNPVNVAAQRPLLPSFEENKKVGLGQFMTRADLAKLDNLSFEDILERLRGTRIIRGTTSHAWLTGTHAGSVIRVKPDVMDSVAGAPRASCWAQIYLNESIVFAGRTSVERRRNGLDTLWEPLFDLESISPAQIEALEYYTGGAETPLKYQRYDPRCGVLVIWTRRSP